MIGQQTRTRTSSAARWQKAAERAVAEGIQIRQLAGSGQWVANSGSDASVAYEVDVTGNVAHGCGCLAGLNDDPVCKHRAAFYLLIGALSVDPEPDPPAPAAADDVCWACAGIGTMAGRMCSVCAGIGTAPLAAQAAALVAAADADVESCRQCGGALDADAIEDEAVGPVCGACVEVLQVAARLALLEAIASDHRQHAEEQRLAA